MLTSNEEISKIGKIYLKTLTSFSSPWWTSQSLTKASSFPINLSVFRKHVCQMPGGRPGMLMPSPRSHDKIANAPSPGTDNVSKCPAVARGGMGTAGIDWCIIILLERQTWMFSHYCSTDFSGKKILSKNIDRKVALFVNFWLPRKLRWFLLNI